MLDGRAPDYLSEKLLCLKYHKSHNTLPYRLPIPRTSGMKRMFFYNAVEQWNNVSDNDLVRRSSDGKKFKRNYFDSVMCVNSRLTILKLTEFLAF